MKCLISKDGHIYIPVVFNNADLVIKKEYRGGTQPSFRKLGKDVEVIEHFGKRKRIWLRLRGPVPANEKTMTAIFKNTTNLPFVEIEPEDIIEEKDAPNIDIVDLITNGSDGQKMLAVYGTIGNGSYRFVEYD